MVELGEGDVKRTEGAASAGRGSAPASRNFL